MKSEDQKGFRFGVRTLQVPKGTNLLDFVNLELARSASEQNLSALELIEMGAVYRNDARVLNPNLLLNKGDLVRIHSSPRRFHSPRDLHERIVSEDSDYLVIEKPEELPLEPTVDNLKENLVGFLSDLRHQIFFPTHRLELETSGLALLAKSLTSQRRAQDAFANGKIKRRYVVFLAEPILMGEKTEVDLHFRVLSCELMQGETNLISEGRMTWRIEGQPISKIFRVEIELIQGRPKDLRTSLAKIGSAVLGDKTLGSPYSLTDSNTGKTQMALKATSLSVSVD